MVKISFDFYYSKVRIGRKAYSNVGQLTEYPPPLSPPPLLPPIKRGQPMIAKVYWRRTIYPISPSSTTTNRPKRKTIYETITTASTNDDDQQRQKNPDKNTEKYIVVYVRKNSNNNSIKTNNNNNVMTMDEPFIASSDNIPQKINIVKKHKNINDDDNNGKKYRSKIPFNELFQSDDEDIVDNDGDGDSWPSDPYDDDDDNDIDDDDDDDNENFYDKKSKNRKKKDDDDNNDDNDHHNNEITRNNDDSDDNDYKQNDKKYQRPISEWPVWNKLHIPPPPSSSIVPSLSVPESNTKYIGNIPIKKTKPIINFYHHQYESNLPEYRLNDNHHGNDNDNDDDDDLDRKTSNKRLKHGNNLIEKSSSPSNKKIHINNQHSNVINPQQQQRRRQKRKNPQQQNHHSKSSQTKKFFKIVNYNIDQ